MTEQRIKVEVEKLRGLVVQAIEQRQEMREKRALAYHYRRQAWFEEAVKATKDMVEALERQEEPENMGWSRRDAHSTIHVDVPAEWPGDYDEKDMELDTMYRHQRLLEMAVDKTILISPKGEYGRYLT